MPAIAKTSDEAVITAARAIVERSGQDGLTMQAVAAAIGVRAPSLYKRFPDHAALVAAVERQALNELSSAVVSATAGQSPAARLRAMAHAYRAFAVAHPRLYALLYSGATVGDPEATAVRREAVEPMLMAFAALVGPGRALPATRVMVAFLHGFASMENAGEFRLGAGVDEAFRLGLRSVIAPRRRRSRPDDR